MHKNKAEKWGVNDDSKIEKIKKEAYREGFSAGKKYIKDNMKLAVNSPRGDLWELLRDEHNLLLLESELDEIIRLARRV